jgi:23S rRNA (adenine2503-C2)-methyltransferase
MNNSVYSLSTFNWQELLKEWEESSLVLPFLLDGLYKDRNIWEKHLSKNLLKNIEKNYDINLPRISTAQEAQDGTIKFLVKFTDGFEVETVLIPFYKRFTVCLSTQVGCAMNCSFCYTGTQGYKRNLSSGEIVSQYLLARNWLKDKNPKSLDPSVVFMGQGEPLHNAEEVKKAIEILNDPKMIGIGKRQMTLSTVGFLPGIHKIKDFTQINFALSLHSPFQEERSKLIPINETHNLLDVIQALDEIPLLPRQFITYEYLLIKDFNMSDQHVEGLTKLLEKRKAIINLIPFNPFPGSHWQRPTEGEIDSFKNKLVANKLRVMVRTTKGAEILAACGQLKVNKLARNKDARSE